MAKCAFYVFFSDLFRRYNSILSAIMVVFTTKYAFRITLILDIYNELYIISIYTRKQILGL